MIFKINLLLAILLSNSVFADFSNNITKQESRKLERVKNYFLMVNKTNAKAFVVVNSEKIHFNLALGYMFIPTLEQYQNKTWLKNKYFNIKSYIQFTSKSNVDERLKNMPIYSFWIESSYLGDKDNFKKSTKKHKMSNYCYAVGDVTFNYKFINNGSVKIIYTDNYNNRKTQENGYTFISKDLLQVRYPSPTYEKVSSTLQLMKNGAVKCINCLPEDIYKCPTIRRSS